MKSVTSAEFQKNFGTYKDAAMRAPVTITNHGRESLVMLSAEEYKRLKAMDARRAYYAHEVPDDILAALEKELDSMSDVEAADLPEIKF